MSDAVNLKAALLGACPQCGDAQLRAVSDGELTNFLCERCGACWHTELAWVHRLDPATCPGCGYRDVCTAADFGPGRYPDRTASEPKREVTPMTTARRRRRWRR